MTADTDTRVDPMHAKKMAALMQAKAKNGSEPGKANSLRIETKAGHGPGKPVTKQIEEQYRCLLFLILATGSEAVRSRVGIVEIAAVPNETRFLPDRGFPWRPN